MPSARVTKKAQATQAAKGRGKSGGVQKPRATRAKKLPPPVSEVSEFDGNDEVMEDDEEDAELDGEDDARRESMSFLELGQSGIGALVDKQREQSKIFLKRFKGELAQKKQGTFASMSTLGGDSMKAWRTTTEEAREICITLLAADPGNTSVLSRESSPLNGSKQALDKFRDIIQSFEKMQARSVEIQKSLHKPDWGEDEKDLKTVLRNARLYGEKLAENAVFPGPQAMLTEFDRKALTGLEGKAVDMMAQAVNTLRGETWGQVAWRQVRGLNMFLSAVFPEDIPAMAEPSSEIL